MTTDRQTGILPLMNTLVAHTYLDTPEDFVALKQLVSQKAGVYDVRHAGSTIAQIIVAPKRTYESHKLSLKSSRHVTPPSRQKKVSRSQSDLDEGARRGAAEYHKEKKVRESDELYIV